MLLAATEVVGVASSPSINFTNSSSDLYSPAGGTAGGTPANDGGSIDCGGGTRGVVTCDTCCLCSW